MNLLQQLLGGGAAAIQTRQLLRQCNQPTVSIDVLRREIEAAERERARHRGHFGLAFALGHACERAGAASAWEERGTWTERALAHYEAAIDLAASGQIEGSDLIPAAASAAWEDDLPPRQRALLAASFHAGLIQSADFRTRDPRRAIEHLTRVVDAVSGSHPARYYLGEALLLDRQFDEAERVWKEGLRFAPEDPALTSVLRHLPVDRVHHDVKIGDWLAVLSDLERVPDGAMPASERLTIEGDARLALGDANAARRCWLAALDLDHVAVGVRRRLRRLDRSDAGRPVL